MRISIVNGLVKKGHIYKRQTEFHVNSAHFTNQFQLFCGSSEQHLRFLQDVANIVATDMANGMRTLQKPRTSLAVSAVQTKRVQTGVAKMSLAYQVGCGYRVSRRIANLQHSTSGFQSSIIHDVPPAFNHPYSTKWQADSKSDFQIL